MKHVRIKLHHKREIHAITIGSRTISITKQQGWNEVPDDIAAVLSEERVDAGNPGSELLFDVVDPAQAKRMEAHEARVRPGTVDAPHRLLDIATPDPARAPAPTADEEEATAPVDNGKTIGRKTPQQKPGKGGKAGAQPEQEPVGGNVETFPAVG